MKKGIFLLIGFCLSLSSSAFATGCEGPGCLPEKTVQSCTVMQANGCIDWEHGIIYATGMGVPNPSFKSAAQKRYGSYTAAKAVAMRNLLQMVENIQISSSQTVKAGMLESDDIKIEIRGTLRQVMEEGRPRVMSDGSTWVTMKMYMKDIRNILVKNEGFDPFLPASAEGTPSTTRFAKKQEAPKAAEVAYGGEATTIYTGLILDARGSGVSPAMSPKVISATGVEVYGSMNVGRTFAVQHGVASYLKNMDKALSHNRVKGKPLVLKATLANSKKGSDLQVSEADAKLLQILAQKQTFLREARVIILL